MNYRWVLWGLCLSIGLAGCGSSGPAEIKDERLTVGRVQSEIKVGMPASQVVEILGSPNIVTTDEKRREVWMYDKVSTDRVDTSTSYGTLIILGKNSRDASSSQRQRTLTIIIKYDEDKKVRDLAYNYTQF